MNSLTTEVPELWVGHTLVAEFQGLITSRDVWATKVRLCRRQRHNKHMKSALIRYERAVMLLDNAQASGLAAARQRMSLPCPVVFVVPSHILDGCRAACVRAAAMGLVRGAFCEYEQGLAWVQEMGEIHRLLSS